MKGSDSVTGSGSAFRKNHQTTALVQHLSELFLQRLRYSPSTLNEAGACGSSEPADDWPVSDLRLGQKMHRCLSAEHDDIQPRYMVADPERRFACGLTVHVESQW